MHVIRENRFGDIRAFQFGFGPVGPPIMSVHIYWLDGVLIDTAQSHMQKQVLAALDHRKPERVLLTHHHEDHSGNAAAISRRFGVPVFGHGLTREKMSRSFAIRPYQHLIWGAARPLLVTSLDGAIETRRFRLEPIHTPGHSKDHTVYLETQNGWLFSGDLYLGDRIKFFRSDERIDETIDSLKRVLAHDFASLFCGHRPCPENGKARLQRKLSFLESFCGRVQMLCRQGYPEKAIVRMLDDRQDLRVKWLTLGNASKANMIRSAIRAAASCRDRHPPLPSEA